MHPIHAVIYLPPAITMDAQLTAHCLEHITRRGYRLVTVARDWPLIDRLSRLDLAQVVVFARHSHIDPTWLPRMEVVGEDTRDLCAGRAPRNSAPRAAEQTRRPRLIS
jgi:hypothetical protein